MIMERYSWNRSAHMTQQIINTSTVLYRKAFREAQHKNYRRTLVQSCKCDSIEIFASLIILKGILKEAEPIGRFSKKQRYVSE